MATKIKNSNPPYIPPLTIFVAVAGPIPLAGLVNHGKKLKKFNGTEFKRWQHNILFYLTILNLARFLNESAPVLIEETTTPKRITAIDA